MIAKGAEPRRLNRSPASSVVMCSRLLSAAFDTRLGGTVPFMGIGVAGAATRKCLIVRMVVSSHCPVPTRWPPGYGAARRSRPQPQHEHLDREQQPQQHSEADRPGPPTRPGSPPHRHRRDQDLVGRAPVLDGHDGSLHDRGDPQDEPPAPLTRDRPRGLHPSVRPFRAPARNPLGPTWGRPTALHGAGRDRRGQEDAA